MVAAPTVKGLINKKEKSCMHKYNIAIYIYVWCYAMRSEIKMGGQGLLLLMELKFLIMMTRPQNITVETVIHYITVTLP